MSHLSSDPVAAAVSLVPFPPARPDGGERRRSIRIPLFTPVRIGPPGGPPDALVSARDLSAGGMFVDADREVRVGATFSVEIPLEDGPVVIPNAEVAYNRTGSAGSGFGVRFVALDADTRAALERAVDGTGPTRVPAPEPSWSVLPTLVPAPDEPLPPEPGFDGASSLSGWSFEEVDDDFEELSRPPLLSAGARERIERLRSRARWLWARLQPVPKAFWALAIAGVGGLIVAVPMLTAGGPDVPAPVRSAEPRPVAPATHRVLMGHAPVAALDADSPAPAKSPKKKVRSLPPLVPIPTPIPEAAPKKPAPSAAPNRFALAIDPGATVLRTHVLTKPDRFVLDVAGQETALDLPAARGRVRRVRTGRHPSFHRVVFDVDAPLEAGRVETHGGTAEVELVFR